MRFYGRELSDYLTGRRKPAQALRLVNMLPADSATVAQMAVSKRQGRKVKPEPWRVLYGQRPEPVLRDLWDLIAAVNTPKGKKAPKYPDPLRSRR